MYHKKGALYKSKEPLYINIIYTISEGILSLFECISWRKGFIILNNKFKMMKKSNLLLEIFFFYCRKGKRTFIVAQVQKNKYNLIFRNSDLPTIRGRCCDFFFNKMT